MVFFAGGVHKLKDAVLPGNQRVPDVLLSGDAGIHEEPGAQVGAGSAS